jgi:hypothetical protein
MRGLAAVNDEDFRSWFEHCSFANTHLCTLSQS